MYRMLINALRRYLGEYYTALNYTIPGPDMNKPTGDLARAMSALFLFVVML